MHVAAIASYVLLPKTTKLVHSSVYQQWIYCSLLAGYMHTSLGGVNIKCVNKHIATWYSE